MLVSSRKCSVSCIWRLDTGQRAWDALGLRLGVEEAIVHQLVDTHAHSSGVQGEGAVPTC